MKADHQAADRLEIIGAPARANGPFRIKLYDFKRPDKFSKDQISTVAMMHETFARLTTASLSAQLRMQAEVHVACVDQLNYQEFVQSIPDPTTLAIINMDPLRGSAILEIDPPLAYSIIDRLCGGRGMGVDPGRSLTNIERTVIETMVSQMLANLGEAWTKVIDLRPRLGQIETQPQFAQIVPPTEMIILVSFETSIGEAKGMINLCIPYLTIEPVIGKLSARYWYSTVSRGDSAARVQRMGTLRVPSALYHQGEMMSLRSLGALKKGATVRIPDREQSRLILQVGGEAVIRLEADKTDHRQYRVLETAEIAPAGVVAVAAGSPAPIPKAFETALEALGQAFDKAISRLGEGLTRISQKQDELADQLLLGDVETFRTKPLERPGRPFGFIRLADADNLVRLIVTEHPQTIALIISYLEPAVAATTLSGLSEETQPDVAARIAALDQISPMVLHEVEHVLRERLSAMGTWELTNAGGIDSVVDLLNLTARSVERNVVESLERQDPELAEEIKKRMFVFEDIGLLDPATMGRILERAGPEDTALALKTVVDKVRQQVLENVPDRPSTELAIARLGRRRLSEVEAAQQRIVSLIRTMEDDGEIVVARPEETID